MKKKLKEKKAKLYDSRIFIGHITKKGVKDMLKEGFIVPVKGFPNIYQTDMSYLT